LTFINKLSFQRSIREDGDKGGEHGELAGEKEEENGEEGEENDEGEEDAEEVEEKGIVIGEEGFQSEFILNDKITLSVFSEDFSPLRMSYQMYKLCTKTNTKRRNEEN